MSLKTVRKPLPEPVETWHPPLETLKAYQQGELSEEEQERIRDHFVFCPECTETMLDLAIFFSGAPREGRLDPDKLVEAWNDWVKNLDQQERSS